MSRDWHRAPLSGLYLDRENGWLFGVCAGMADRFDIDLNVLRLVVLAGAIFVTMPTVVAYGLAAWLLQDRPLQPRDPAHERAFWRAKRDGGGY
ncbi:MAG: PspC domain-containing protein [Pseudomonadota bacterium]